MAKQRILWGMTARQLACTFTVTVNGAFVIWHARSLAAYFIPDITGAQMALASLIFLIAVSCAAYLFDHIESLD